MIKKYLHILFFLIILWQINISFAVTYDDYKDNVAKVCNNWEYKNNKVYKNTDFYLKAEDYKNNSIFWAYFTNTKELFPLDWVKKIYIDIQNNIYKCGMYQAQINAYNMASNAIRREKKWLLNDSIGKVIESKKKLIKNKIINNKCKTNKDEELSKHQVLDQSTYELCNYIFYLDYLNNWYYNEISNMAWFDNLNSSWINSQDKNQSIQTQLLASQTSSIKQNIENEVQYSYNMYNMAFDAFSEYDSFLAIHIMLEIIKQDYIVFRDTFYSAISPINQVWYKVIHAMSD